MKNRSKSCYQEREPFEEPKQNWRVHSDNEEDDNSNDVIPLTSNWSMEENEDLLKQINELLPKSNATSYVRTLNKIDWSNIKIKYYKPDEIKEHFIQMIKCVRKHRSLREVIGDCDREKIQKAFINKPKKALSAYNLFFQDKFEKVKAENPAVFGPQLTKKIAELYQAMSPKKKKKYTEKAEILHDDYQKTLAEFNKNHPDLNKKTSSKIKSKTPFDLYMKEQRTNGVSITYRQAAKDWKALPMALKIIYIKNFLLFNDNGYSDLVLPKPDKAALDEFEGKPAKPKIAYQMFVDDIRSEFAHLPFAEMQKKFGEQWKNTAMEVKEEYAQKYKKANKKYEEKLKTYLTNLPEDRQNQILAKKKKEKIAKKEKLAEKNKDAKPKKSKKSKAPALPNGNVEDYVNMDIPTEDETPKKKKKKSKKQDTEPVESDIAVTEVISKKKKKESAAPIEPEPSTTKKRKEESESSQFDAPVSKKRKHKKDETPPPAEEDDKSSIINSPTKKKKKKKKNLLVRPPKNVFSLYAMTCADGDYNVAKSKWKNVSEKEKKVLTKQLVIMKADFMDEVKRRIISYQEGGSYFDDKSVVPCPCDFSSPDAEEDSEDSEDDEDSS